MALEILVQTGTDTNLNRNLHLFPDTAFTINYEIANVNDIANSGGAYTKTIVIPDDNHNREIFGYISDLSTDLGYNYYSNLKNSFNPNKRYRCYVLEDSVKVLEGYLQLKQMTFDYFNNSKSYEVTIYADNANFYQSLGDSLLTDLDFSEYNFVLSPQTITASWVNNYDAYKNGYYFNWQDNGNGYSIDDITSGRYILKVKDFAPAVFVKPIWDKIYATRSINQVTNFLDGSNSSHHIADPRFGNLVIPYNQQRFENAAGFNQDKIIHVGLSASTLGSTNNYTPGDYAAHTPMIIANATHHLWYSGRLLSPFESDSRKNNNIVTTTYSWHIETIPFNDTTTPMFDTVVNGRANYNTASNYYQNNHDFVFNQRFIFNTDIVTTYNADGRQLGGSTPQNQFYQMWAAFYREINPITGTTHPGWAGGTGSIVPPDYGGYNYVGTFSASRKYDGKFWICFRNDSTSGSNVAISNVFDRSGKLIAPQGNGMPGGDRYLGKYSTTQLGENAINAETGYNSYSTPDNVYYMLSGDCVSYYYNSASSSGCPAGIWCSGGRTGTLMSTGLYNQQPLNGDWYQDLMMQTIYLDGDTSDPVYSDPSSPFYKLNTPIQPGERVRLVVGFGGRYTGGNDLSTTDKYKPPTAAYLVSYTDFSGNNQADGSTGSLSTIAYDYPASTNIPRTVFYNEVSPEYVTGQTINFNDIIPKNIKQRDFVQSIVQMHNLYIEPKKDEPNTLIIEPREDFYKLGTTALDWTSRIDLTTPIKIQVLAETQNKSTLFTFKKDNDYYNKQYTQLTNECYGQYKNVIDNDFLTGEKKIESIFSPTPMVQLYSTNPSVGGSSIQGQGGFIIPVLVNGANVNSTNSRPNNYVQTNYRILYKNVIQNQNSDTVKFFGYDTHVYPYAGPYDNPYTPSYAVNWGQTLGEFFKEATDQFYDNLVTTYWAGLLTELTNIDSKIITVSMFLTPYDIQNFNFYKLIFLTIDGVDGYYKVNSIEDYIPGHNTVCKVTLLKSSTALVKNVFVPTSYTPPIGTMTPAPPDNPVE